MNIFALIFTAVVYAILPDVGLDKLQMIITIMCLYGMGAVIYSWLQDLRQRRRKRRA